MQLGVCQNPSDLKPGTQAWQQLVDRTRQAWPDLLLLNEMPFGRWFSALAEPEQALFRESTKLHEAALDRLGELQAPWVLGSRPAWDNGSPVNQAFAWHREKGFTGGHTKQFFPEEEGFYEARWFERGAERFTTLQAGELRVGFMICTDVMFNEWARHYRRKGAHVIAVPRAVGPHTLKRWKTAMTMAAIVSGCYVISSNRAGTDAHGQTFGGCGWIFHPDGSLVAETSAERPLVTAELDPKAIEQARNDYPCYVKELNEELPA